MCLRGLIPSRVGRSEFCYQVMVVGSVGGGGQCDRRNLSQERGLVPCFDWLIDLFSNYLITCYYSDTIYNVIVLGRQWHQTRQELHLIDVKFWYILFFYTLQTVRNQELMVSPQLGIGAGWSWESGKKTRGVELLLRWAPSRQRGSLCACLNQQVGGRRGSGTVLHVVEPAIVGIETYFFFFLFGATIVCRFGLRP